MNDYMRTIDLLMSPDIDYREIVIEIAKKHPDILMEAAQTIENEVPWKVEVDISLRAGLKIDAIKRWRQATGLGLKEAKDAVEIRHEELGL